MGRIRYLGASDGAQVGGAPAPGELFDVSKGRSLSLGSAAGVDVHLEGGDVASAHLMLAVAPDEPARLVVTDLVSNQVTVVAPDEELVVGGVFTFRFEDAPGPRPPSIGIGDGARRWIGAVLLVLGALAANLATCSDSGWWSNRDGSVESGLWSYERCAKERDYSTGSSWNDDEVVCRDERLGARGDDANLFQMLAGFVGVVVPVYWCIVVVALFGILRRGRTTMGYWLIAFVGLALLASLGLVLLLPMNTDAGLLTSTGWAVYIYWLACAAMIAACILFWPGRRQDGTP